MDIKKVLADIRKYEDILHGHMKTIAYYDQHERLPEPKQTIDVDDLTGFTILELVKKLMNNRAYCSKYRKKVEMADEVDSRKAEVDKIEEMLKKLGPYNQLING